MDNPEQRIKIAVQKTGRLTDHSLDLLERCGLKFRQSKDQLFCYGENMPIDLLFVRDDAGNKTRYGYDETNNRTKEIDPFGNTREWEFNAGPFRLFRTVARHNMSDLVSDNSADAAVIHRCVSIRIKERRLKNAGGDAPPQPL